MKPLRVLVVGWTATTGGIEHFLMAYCGKINRERVQFDFLCRFSPIACQKEAEKIGKIYTITRRSSDIMRYYREINDFFREHGHEYDIIWDNECMFNDMTPLKKAAEVGIPVRIAHCHNPQNMDKSVIGHVQGFLHRVNHHSLSRYANVLWACSMESAKWACPAMDLPCEVIPNAIDAQMFRFSEQVRREVREQYGLEDCLVVGHVGRLQYQKNQTFLLDAFRHLHEREEKARLVLVGDGPDLTELEAKAVTLGIEREVLFLGNRDDVNRLLQAFDLFVMPSHFEGFGMAALEAQAAGLPCLLSASVPRETKLTRNVEFIPAEDPAIWAEHMLNMLERHEIRRDEAQTIADAGYDIGTAAQRLEDKLIALTERKRFQRRFLMTPKTSASGVPALNKARADIEQIAAEMGYAPFVPRAGQRKWHRLASYPSRRKDAWRLGSRVLPDAAGRPAARAVPVFPGQGLRRGAAGAAPAALEGRENRRARARPRLAPADWGEAPRAGATSCCCRGSRRSSCTVSGWKATCARWA